MKTIKGLAEEMSQALEWKERNNGSKFVSLKNGSPEWMHDVCWRAHNNGETLPDDTIYEFIDKAVNALSECSGNSLPDLQEAIDQIEPDIYTSDLTSWLGARVDHVFYLTEALENSESRDGFQVLLDAQSIQINEVSSAVLAALQEVIEGMEELEDEADQ